MSVVEGSGWCDGSTGEAEGMLHQVKCFTEERNGSGITESSHAQLWSLGLEAGGNCSCSFHLPGQPDKFSLTKERFGKADFF